VVNSWKSIESGSDILLIEFPIVGDYFASARGRVLASMLSKASVCNNRVFSSSAQDPVPAYSIIGAAEPTSPALDPHFYRRANRSVKR
jgi:hypothetical protein